jgi:hypothetical protein
MTIPIEIFENDILKYVDVIDVWHYSITCQSNIFLFKSETLWQFKCNLLGSVDKVCSTWMEQCVGKRVPLIDKGDCIRYIYVSKDTVFPMIPKRIAMINHNGRVIKKYQDKLLYHFSNRNYNLPINNIVNRGVIVTYPYLAVDKLENEVKQILYSRHGNPPIYSYTVEYLHKGETEMIIIENITLPTYLKKNLG